MLAAGNYPLLGSNPGEDKTRNDWQRNQPIGMTHYQEQQQWVVIKSGV